MDRKTALGEKKSDIFLGLLNVNSCDNVTHILCTEIPYKAENTTCNRKRAIQCSDGSCLLTIHQCDGQQHCRDGSDENNCYHHYHVAGMREADVDLFFCKYNFERRQCTCNES